MYGWLEIRFETFLVEKREDLKRVREERCWNCSYEAIVEDG